MTREEEVMPTDYKLYIARDGEGVYDNDEPNDGRGLNIFYDIPLWDGQQRRWGTARKIANIPDYMFPDIKEGEYQIFVPSTKK